MARPERELINMEIRKLEIRRLKEEELGKALTLVWEVFQEEVAPLYTEEGVREFLKFIDYNHMKDLYEKGNIIFWGAFEEEVIGMMAVRNDGHISLFFVKNEYQGMGIGKALFQMMFNYCVEELKVKKITVNAAPDSVMKYIHMGMRQVGTEEEKCGIRSIPMEMYASPTLVKPIEFRPKKKKNKNKIVAGIIVIIVAVIIGLGILGFTLFKRYVNVEIRNNEYSIPQQPYGDPYEDFYEDFFGDFYDDYYEDDYYGNPSEDEPTFL